jgi:hypothetical protein
VRSDDPQGLTLEDDRTWSLLRRPRSCTGVPSSIVHSTLSISDLRHATMRNDPPTDGSHHPARVSVQADNDIHCTSPAQRLREAIQTILERAMHHPSSVAQNARKHAHRTLISPIYLRTYGSSVVGRYKSHPIYLRTYGSSVVGRYKSHPLLASVRAGRITCWAGVVMPRRARSMLCRNRTLRARSRRRGVRWRRVRPTGSR